MITELSAAELSRRLRDRSLSAPEVAEAHVRAIERLDPRLKAFITVDYDGAVEEARRAQASLDSGNAGPLTGVPVAVKDNLATRGLRTTCGSRFLEDYVPPFDAAVVERCRAAGMVVLGKTNLDEFAMGTSTENSAFFPTRNPWNAACSPGGSSGGSAAAVAAGLAPLALGSDTGGSIRQPAALCGVVGFKPTYGRVSRYGLVAFGSSLDQIGPLARTVEDAALLAQTISGPDPRDGTCLPRGAIDISSLRSGEVKGLRIGLPKELFGEDSQADVLREVNAAIQTLSQEGVEFEEVSLPSIRYGVTTYYIIAPAEASSNLARFDGIRYGSRRDGSGHVDVVEKSREEGFGHEVKARIMMGTYVLSAGYYDAYYLRAQQVRALMSQEIGEVLDRFDAILSPTSPCVAFQLGALKQHPMALKLLDYCTIPANLGGFPAVSLNCGFADGLPVGLQLMAGRMRDERLLQIAYSVETLLPNAQRRPSVREL